MVPVSRYRTSSSPEHLQERLIAFSVGTWEGTAHLQTSPAKARLRDQVIRSATSVAANYGEARSAESRRDFIHKMQISLKELRETGVWLEIVGRLDNPDRVRVLAAECNELPAISVTSIQARQLMYPPALSR